MILYTIKTVNDKSGKEYVHDLIPMTHSEAMTMISKMSVHPYTRHVLYPV